MKLNLKLMLRVRIYSEVMVTNLQGAGFLVRVVCLGPSWNLLEKDGGCQCSLLGREALDAKRKSLETTFCSQLPTLSSYE